jgi:cell pole-organizing protein PopZ
MSAVSSSTSDREGEALRRAQRAHEPSMEEILASIRNIIADDRENARTSVRGPVQRTAAPASGPQIVYSKDADLGPAPRAELPAAPKTEMPDEGRVDELVSPRVVWSYAPALEADTAADAPLATAAANKPKAKQEPSAAVTPEASSPDNPVEALRPALAEIETTTESALDLGKIQQAAVPATAQPAAAAAEATKDDAATSGGEAALLSPEANKAVAFACTDLSATLARRADEAADGMIREMLRPLLKDWLDRNMPEVVEKLVKAEIERITQAPR